MVEPDEAQNNDNLQIPCMLAIISEVNWQYRLDEENRPDLLAQTTNWAVHLKQQIKEFR